MAMGTARLLISCPDRKNIIAAVAGFIARHGGNILQADQHTDPQKGEFFMRVEIELDGFALNRQTFSEAWEPVAAPFGMSWRVYWGNEIKRMAVLVSKESHCLNDILWRWKTGELRTQIAFVASNHQDLHDAAGACAIPFHHLPVMEGKVERPNVESQRSETFGPSDLRPSDLGKDQESRLLSLLRDANVDLIVLARYMQVLSPEFVAQYPERIINIHHSFLPAFAGPRPYHQAFQRGVKIIGATIHYVKDVLDEGPIIAQATTPVDHRDTVDDLVRKGRDLERVVLARAVRQHVEDKILVSQNKTIVFD